MANEDRKTVLLKAAYELLKQCHEGIFVRNALEVPVIYDGVENDGFSLANDIADELGLTELV